MKSLFVPNEVSRRDFLKTAAGTAAGLALTGTMAQAQSSSGMGDATIKLALVGCGGRGSGAADQAMNTGNVKLVAMADTFETRLNTSLEALAKKHPDFVNPNEVQKFVGFDSYKKAIAAADVVILATSPGFRSFHFEEAVRQGKHIFMEKPLGVDAPSMHRILDANVIAKQKNLKVGVGFQRRHQNNYLEAYDRIKNGDIGEILNMRVYWRGGSRGGEAKRPGETEMQYQIRNWYFFTYLSGDHIVEQHCHNIDVGNWFKGAYPVSATGLGGRQTRTNKECGQIFDHHFVEFEYADGTTMFSQCSQFPAKWGNISENLTGSKGSADFHDQRGFVIKGAKPWRFKGKADIGWQTEHYSLFKAIREGTPYNEAEYGAMSTMTAIMGRMATYSGAKVSWEDAFGCQTKLISTADFNWDDTPPVVPDADGFYPTFHPGRTSVC